jgi:hypothetical protein
MLERRFSGRRETLESVSIDRLRLGGDQIPGRLRLQNSVGGAVRLENLAQPRDRPVNSSRGSVRRSLSPNGVDQPVEGDNLVRV